MLLVIIHQAEEIIAKRFSQGRNDVESWTHDLPIKELPKNNTGTIPPRCRCSTIIAKHCVTRIPTSHAAYSEPSSLQCGYHLFNRARVFSGDYQLGANAAGFKKVADAMIDQGQVFSNNW